VSVQDPGDISIGRAAAVETEFRGSSRMIAATIASLSLCLGIYTSLPDRISPPRRGGERRCVDTNAPFGSSSGILVGFPAHHPPGGRVILRLTGTSGEGAPSPRLGSTLPEGG